MARHALSSIAYTLLVFLAKVRVPRTHRSHCADAALIYDFAFASRPFSHMCVCRSGLHVESPLESQVKLRLTKNKKRHVSDGLLLRHARFHICPFWICHFPDLSFSELTFSRIVQFEIVILSFPYSELFCFTCFLLELPFGRVYLFRTVMFRMFSFQSRPLADGPFSDHRWLNCWKCVLVVGCVWS